jgi:hypothetical protein
LIQDISSELKAPETPFRATPEKIVFRDYDLNEIYSGTLSLVNCDKVIRRIKFVPPKR